MMPSSNQTWQLKIKKQSCIMFETSIIMGGDYRKVFIFLWQKKTENATHPQVTHVNELDFISWLQALGTPVEDEFFGSPWWKIEGA